MGSVCRPNSLCGPVVCDTQVNDIQSPCGAGAGEEWAIGHVSCVTKTIKFGYFGIAGTSILLNAEM